MKSANPNQSKFFSGSVVHAEKYYDFNEVRYVEILVKNFCKKNKFDFKDSYSENFLDGPYETVVILYTKELIPSYQEWCGINQQCLKKGKMLYVISDAFGHISDLSQIKFFLRPQLSGVWKILDSPPHLPNKKLFTCFVQRVDSVRQSWFYFLHDHGLLDKGHVSFWFDQLTKSHGSTRKDVFEKNHYDFGLDKLPHFARAFDALKNQVPFCNFQGDIDELIASSKYSIVLETFATNDSHTAFSCNEKTFRDLQFGTQPLIFAQPGLLKELAKNSMIIPQYLDKVDKILQWPKRQQMLLDMLIQDNVNLSCQENIDRAMHNRDVMNSWREKYHQNSFFDDIFDQIIH